jgi:hypothetical protein
MENSSSNWPNLAGARHIGGCNHGEFGHALMFAAVCRTAQPSSRSLSLSVNPAGLSRLKRGRVVKKVERLKAGKALKEPHG